MRHGLRSVLATASALVTAVALTAVAGPALAVPDRCATVGSARDARATDCMSAFRLRAEAAGRAAEQADETYLQAKQATAVAHRRLQRLDALARQAEAATARSKERAATVAAQLVRGGGSVGPTAEILFSGKAPRGMLYSLSRMTELSADTARAASAMQRDSRAAARLRAQAGVAADRVASNEVELGLAYAAARTTARAAVTLVRQTEIKSGGDASRLATAYVDLPSDAPTADKVVAFAAAQIGKPYVFGAAGPGTWDCSGLTMEAFAAAGIGIGGHGATVQYTTAAHRGLLVPYAQAEPGDLLFYAGDGDMAHVTIYAGGGRMIEAPSPGRDVRETPVRPEGLEPLVARFTS